MTRDEFISMTPSDLYVNLTARLYDAIRSDNYHVIDSIMSCFDEDARHELAIGTACLRAMGDPDYRDALRHAMASTLYNEMKEART